MASALQRLFKKRLGKQQSQNREQRRNGDRQNERPQVGTAATSHNAAEAERRQSYFTVDSLNSPIPASRMSTASSSFFPAAPSSDYAPSRAGSSSQGHGRRRSSFGVDTVLRHDSGTARYWTSATMTDSAASMPVDQFGNILSPIRGPKSSCSSQHQLGFMDSETEHTASRPPSDDEDDVTANPLYISIFNNKSLAESIARSRVILLPDADAFSSAGRDDLSSDAAYLALHVFAASELFKGQYESTQRSAKGAQTPANIGLTAILQPESRTVKLILSHQKDPKIQPARQEYKLEVQEETTTFNSLRNRETGRKERIRIRVLTVKGFVLAPNLYDSLLGKGAINGAPDSSKTELVDSHAHGEASARPRLELGSRKGTDTSESGDKVDLIPNSRIFLHDLAFLLHADEKLASLQPALDDAFRTIQRAAEDFTNAYIYVPGFDTYNASRIRRGILARAWQAFEDSRAGSSHHSLDDMTKLLGSNWRQRLLLLLENVVMGFCHGKVYSSLCATMQEQDDHFDALLAAYSDAKVALQDLDASSVVSTGSTERIESAAKILSRLAPPEEDLQDIIQRRDYVEVRALAELAQTQSNVSTSLNSTTDSPQQEIARAIRTPLDVLQIMSAAAKVIATGRATRSGYGDYGDQLSTDALLPLIAFIIVQTRPRRLFSAIYYVKVFGISDATPADLSWALATFETAVEFLKSDPVKLGVGAFLGDAASMQSKATLGSRGTIAKIETRQPEGWSSAAPPRDSQSTRHRHISLPGSVKRTTHGIEANAPQTEAHRFKMPIAPASASKSRNNRPIEAKNTTHVANENVRHQRSPSMSKEVSIRPQIVVRIQPSASSQVSSRTGTFERAQSETDAFAYRSSSMTGQQARLSRPLLSRLDTRRKSLDSSTTLSIFSALGIGSKVPSERDERQIASAVDNADEPSELPLPLRQSDTSTMTPTLSAPLAHGQDHDTLLRSNSTQSAHLSSLDSLPSLDTHATSTEGHGSELSTSPRRPTAPVQFPLQAAGNSPAMKPDEPLHGDRGGRSDRSGGPGKRDRRRSRLLSITSIGQVTPSLCTADAATALATPTNVERMWSDVDKGTTASPPQTILQHVAGSEATRTPKSSGGRSQDVDDCLADMTTETIIDHFKGSKSKRSQDGLDGTSQNIRDAGATPERDTHAQAGTSTGLRRGAAPSLRLLIPTPVEEVADPISLRTSW